jgi:MFS family permease
MKQHRKSFMFLVFSQVVMAAGFALSFPFLAVYLNTHRDISMSLIGIFLALSVFFTSFAQILGGEISDKIGRKQVMQIALLLRGISILIIAYLIKVEGSVALIMLSQMIGVFFGSFFRPAANSWVADSVTPTQRVRAYGLLRMGINLGWALGPALGGFMAQSSYAMMFFYTFISNIICVFIIGFFVKNTIVDFSGKREKLNFQSIKQVLKNEKFMRFCIAIFTMAIVMSQLIVSSSLYCVK